MSPSRSSVSPSPSTSTPPSGGVAPALHVSGNKLVTAKGQTYRLLGSVYLDLVALPAHS